MAWPAARSGIVRDTWVCQLALSIGLVRCWLDVARVQGSAQTGATIELGHMSVWDIIDNYEDKNGFKKYYNEATQTAYVYKSVKGGETGKETRTPLPNARVSVSPRLSIYSPNTKIWVGYDDEKAILAKVIIRSTRRPFHAETETSAVRSMLQMHLAHSHSLGGVFVWLIDDDRHFDVWNEMHRFSKPSQTGYTCLNWLGCECSGLQEKGRCIFPDRRGVSSPRDGSCARFWSDPPACFRTVGRTYVLRCGR